MLRGGSRIADKDNRLLVASSLLGLAAVTVLLAVGGVGFVVLLGMTAVAVLLTIAIKRPVWFSHLAIGSTFLSRFSVDAGGFNVRFEIIIGLVALIAIIAMPGRASRKVDATLFLIMGCWVVWLVIVTFLVGPSFTDSLTVLVWLFLNLATVIYLVLNVQDLQIFVATGVRLALAAAVLGLALWMLATFADIAWLVQVDPTYGGYAVYATAYEANILASLVTLWSAVAISSRLCSRCNDFMRIGLILLTPFVAVATHTRIALVASMFVILVAIIFYPRSRVYLVAALVFIACAAAVATVQLDQIGLSKFSGQFSLGEGTGKYRSDSWLQARRDIADGGWEASLFGLGANSFGQRHLDPTLVGTGARWYLGSLPLQIFYDGGLVAVILVGGALIRVFPTRSYKLALAFIAVYSLFAVSTSTLWLLQSWIFLAIVLIDSRDSHKIAYPVAAKC